MQCPVNGDPCFLTGVLFLYSTQTSLSFLILLFNIMQAKERRRGTHLIEAKQKCLLVINE